MDYFRDTNITCENRMITATACAESVSGMTEIVFIEKGFGTRYTTGKSVPCRENEIYLIGEGIPQSFVTLDPNYPLMLRKIKFRKQQTEGEPDVLYAFLTKDSREEIVRLFDRIYQECSEKKYDWIQAVQSYLSLIYICVNRYTENSILESDPSKKPSDTVQFLMRAVETRFGNQELTLEQLAKESFVSASTLSRRFQRIVGQPFSCFLRNYRMEQACRLLKESSYPVSDIASLCGIRDLPTFYRLFQNYAHKTPQKFRKDCCNNSSASENEDALVLISRDVQEGKADAVTDRITRALNEGIPADSILSSGLISGMTAVGIKFKQNDIYIPEVLLAARAMNKGLELLRPELAKCQSVNCPGKALICTVQGDMHDIGKNIVRIMLEGRGIECIDLGVDVAPEAIVEAALKNEPDIICLSTLLTTTLASMETAVKMLKSTRFHKKVLLMVGGAPVTQNFAEKIGADVYTEDAASAAEEALLFLQHSSKSAENSI